MDWVKGAVAFVKEQGGAFSFAAMAVAGAVIWTPFGASLVRPEWLPRTARDGGFKNRSAL